MAPRSDYLASRHRRASRAALLLAAGLGAGAAVLAACSPPPPAPRPPPVATVPTATAAAAETAPRAREYSDLGPAHLVPQLGVDTYGVAISPDGLLALTANGAGDLMLRVWDIERRQVVAELAPPRGQITFGFAHGGRFIVAEASSSAAVWDGQTGQLVGQIGSPSGYGRIDFEYEKDTPEAFFHDEAGKALVLRTFAPGPDVFRAPVSDEPYDVAISGGRYIARYQKKTEVYDRAGKLLETLPDTAETTSEGVPVRTPVFEPKQSRVTSKPLADKLPGDCFQAREHAVCTAYEDDRTNVYVADLRGDEPKVEKLPSRLDASIEIDEQGKGLVLHCRDGSPGTLGFPPGSPELAAAEKELRITAAARRDTPGAALVRTKKALVAVVDGRIAIWDLATEKKRADFQHEGIFRDVMLVPSPDGKLFAVAGQHGSKTVEVFDIEKGTHLRTIDHGHYVWTVLWNPDSSVLCTTARMPSGGLYLGDEDASVKLWSPATGKLLRTIPHHYGAQYSDDNSLFVTSSYDEVQVHDARTLKKLASATGAYMYAVLSPDSKWMINPITDTTHAHPGMYEESGIQLRSTRTGALLQSFGFKTGSVDISPDSSRLLLSTSQSWTVDNNSRSFDLGVYSVATGKRERFWSHHGSVEGARFALGGKLVTARVRNMWWLARPSDGASLWILPVQGNGQCTAAVFDDTGRFEADGVAMSGLAFRLGDDLRRSAVVREGPKVEALRAPGLFRSFIDAAR